MALCVFSLPCQGNYGYIFYLHGFVQSRMSCKQNHTYILLYSNHVVHYECALMSSFADGHLGYFQSLAVNHNGVKNNPVDMSFWIYVSLTVVKMSRLRITRSKGNCIFNFYRLFSKGIVKFQKMLFFYFSFNPEFFQQFYPVRQQSALPVPF